ncbi:hypothetical protein Tco_0816512 [Tanacetum coccineum]
MVAFLGSLPVPLEHVKWIPSYSDNFIKKGDGDGKWHAKIKEMLEIKVYEMGGDEEIFTSEAWRCTFDINELVYTELCHEFYATYEFDETITDEELMPRKLIKFRLGGRGHTLTILEFTRRLGLYTSDEIQDEGFKTYFRGGLRTDDHFNVNQYWSEISSENELIMSMSSARTISKPVLRVLQKMITYGFCQRTTGYANVAWLIAKWLKRKGVGSQRDNRWIPLPPPPLRELIGSNGRLIAKEPAHGDLRVAVPRPPCHSISNLYDKMGRMEIRQGELERMSRRQSYHYDKCAGLFEYIAGHYDVPLQVAYAHPVMMSHSSSIRMKSSVEMTQVMAVVGGYGVVVVIVVVGGLGMTVGGLGDGSGGWVWCGGGGRRIRDDRAHDKVGTEGCVSQFDWLAKLN